MSGVEPSYEELAGLVVELMARLEQADVRIAALEAEVAKLRAQRDKDSTNSSIPPSADSIAAKARRKAAGSQRIRSADRQRGGQPGHPGCGLTRTADPTRTERVGAPTECVGCGCALDGEQDADTTWAQVWDTLPVVWEKVHYVLPRRRCARCGRMSTATVPFARAGSVTYGPNVTATAVLLNHEANVPVQATARVMRALLGATVSSGFVARAHQRLAETLDTVGFDAAMACALRAEAVLCADETPVNVVRNLDPAGQSVVGSPQVICVRTPDARLVWFKDVASRSSESIRGLGVMDGFTGVLVRDDYAGWYQFDAQLAGVQQCCQHLLRSLRGVAALDSDNQAWADQVAQALRDAGRLANRAVTTSTGIDSDVVTALRWRYDQGVAVGISVNLSRPWPGGNHPGLTLARRLKAKAEQVWLFTTNPKIPWTNNASEQALRGPKRHQAVSGYWQSTHTLSRYCRVRSYLASARNHGIRAIDAIRSALTGKPWMPVPALA